MSAVAEELVRLTNNYEDTYKTEELVAILGYIDATYKYRFDSDDKYQYGYAVKQRIKQGLELLLNNRASRMPEYDNQHKLKLVYDIIYHSADYSNYLPILKTKLSEIRGDFFKDDESLAAIRSMFNTWKEITRIDPDDIYIQNKPKYVIDANKKVAEDTSYITAFKYFYDNNTSLMSTKYEEVLMDAVVSLAGGLNHEQLRSKIRPQIKEVLRGLDINSRGSSVYVAAVGALSSYDVDKKTRKNNCTEYDTCNIKERWVEQYMPSKKSCSPYIKIIAQPEISAERLEEACRLVLAEEKLFIYSLFGVSPDKAFMASGTKEKPKFDSGLEMILFKTKAMGWTPPQLTGIKVPNW